MRLASRLLVRGVRLASKKPVSLPTMRYLSTKNETTEHTKNVSKFNGEYLRKEWYPRAYSDSGKPLIIPCTYDWKADHLFYFNIHCIRTNDDWQHYLCPHAPLTPDAVALSNYKFSAIEFSLGVHEEAPNDKDPKDLRDFGNIISELVCGSSSEASVEHLARFLTNACNPDRRHLLPISRLMIATKFGNQEYTSVPDQLLGERMKIGDPIRYIFLANENKLDVQYVEPQLGGEMLAVAIRNYLLTKIGQTLFGMALKGSLVSIYRAEFSQEYLESVVTQGKPKGHIVMYKFSGTSEHGVDVSRCGDDRTLLLEVLCSVLAFCKTDILPHLKDKVALPCTSQRLALLSDISQ